MRSAGGPRALCPELSTLQRDPGMPGESRSEGGRH